MWWLCQVKQLLQPGPSMEPCGSFVGITMVMESQPGNQLVAPCLQLSLSHKEFQMLPPILCFLTDDIEGLSPFSPQFFLRFSLLHHVMGDAPDS